MKKRVVLKVYGKVQGVFFRDSTQRKAKELNLSGWVSNELDGTVQIVAEGEEGDFFIFKRGKCLLMFIIGFCAIMNL